MQNEPTATEPRTSADGTKGCDEPPDAPDAPGEEVPDPQEMERLRQIAERASRYRPDPVFGPF